MKALDPIEPLLGLAAPPKAPRAGCIARARGGVPLAGRLDNLHEMTIAGAKSEVMMKLTTNITGKLAQATTQLFQMQI